MGSERKKQRNKASTQCLAFMGEFFAGEPQSRPNFVRGFANTKSLYCMSHSHGAIGNCRESDSNQYLARGHLIPWDKIIARRKNSCLCRRWNVLIGAAIL